MSGAAQAAASNDGATVPSRCALQHAVRNWSTFLLCLRAVWATVIRCWTGAIHTINFSRVSLPAL